MPTITSTDFEPLSIECKCPGGLGGECEVSALIIQGAGSNDGFGGVNWDITLSCGSFGGLGAGGGTLTFPGACVNSSGTVSYFTGRSTTSDTPAIAMIKIDYLAEYTCIVGEDSFVSYHPVSVSGSGDEALCTGATGKDFDVFISAHSALGVSVRSRPLGCTGATASMSVDLTSPLEAGSSGPSSGYCFCASGGTILHYDTGDSAQGPVQFAIVGGRLAEGLIFNEETGCVQGERVDGGDPGTSTITVQVTDLYSGETASAECGFLTAGCTGGGPIYPGNRQY